MKCARMGAFRGAWGDWSPHKKSKGVWGAWSPHTQKKSPNPSKERGMKGSVISAYQRVANMAYIERTMLISRMTYSRSY